MDLYTIIRKLFIKIGFYVDLKNKQKKYTV
jgi:hypothetical protein